MGTIRDFERLTLLAIAQVRRLRLLSDPLRLRLVHAFADEPRTTKQVATVLGEKPTRLYHHVAQLEEAGLLELVETRPVRGTTEKYYRSVGRAFAASPTLFRGPEGAGPAQEMIDGILSQTRAELEGLGLDTLDEDDPLGPWWGGRGCGFEGGPGALRVDREHSPPISPKASRQPPRGGHDTLGWVQQRG